MEVILRADNVEKARAGDKVTFIGNPIVVPDVAAISAPGERLQMQPGRSTALQHPCKAHAGHPSSHLTSMTPGDNCI